MCTAATRILLLTFLLAALWAATAHAVMPPESYVDAILASRIKAIATVIEVETLEVGRHYSEKRATFQCEYALIGCTAGTFKAYYRSVETPEQEQHHLMGGAVYFHPRVGERVFVTVSVDSGALTSLTPATRELERMVREEPERIGYTVSSARILDKDGKQLGKVVPPEELDRRKRHMEQRKGKKPVTDIGDCAKAVNGHVTGQDELQGRLLVALGDDDTEEAARLLKDGAAPNHSNSHGMTPLMYADSEAMARLLVERGADPMKTDDKGSTLLHYAVVKNDAPSLIRYYIDLGVDPNQRGAHDSTPAAIAVMYFQETDDSSRTTTAESVLRALVEGGADLDIQEANGQTLLMDAIMHDDRPMTALLLKLGADRSIRDMNGKTAEDWAIELGNTDLVQLLNH